MRYVEADILDEEDDDDDEDDKVGNKVTAPTPNKKPKASRKDETSMKAEDIEEPAMKEADDLPVNSNSKSSKKETKKTNNKRKKGRKGRTA